MLRRRALLLALSCLSLAACRDGLGIPEDDPRRDLGGGPDLATSPCGAHLDLDSCQADARCEASACKFCNEVAFGGCYGEGEAPWLGCPAISCDECSSYGTEVECDLAPGCASSFREGGLCLCDGPGCCMRFDRCLTKADVSCAPSASGPQCGQPEWQCPEAYATVYEGACEVGCVAKDVCVDDYDCSSHGCQIGYVCSSACTERPVCLPEGAQC